MGWLKKKKIQADIAERSYLQWNLIRSLAFGERDWITLCAIFFLLSEKREFLSITGFSAMALGIFFLGPVFGMFIHMTTKLIYFRRKKAGTLPKTSEALLRLTWLANAFCAPVIIGLGWLAFDLFYLTVEGIVNTFNTTAEAAQNLVPQ